MITKNVIKEKLADLEKEYVDFMVRQFGEWETWAKTSQKMADGEEVEEKEIPEAFIGLKFFILSYIAYLS